MNSKAQRQQLEWPPLLNLSKDRPHVDPSFKNVEKVNAPYLNSMLQPLWKKPTGRKSTYDVYGNEYYIEDNELRGDLIPNGKEIANEKFVKRELDFTALDGDVISYSPESALILYKDRSTRTTKLTLAVIEDGVYKSSLRTDTLLSADCNVLEARIRYVNGLSVIVIYYDLNNIEYVFIGRWSTDSFISNHYNSQAVWYKQKVNYGRVPTYTTTNSVDLDPVIHIGSTTGGLIYVSLTAYTGEVIPGPDAWFMTFWVPTSSNVAVKQVTNFSCSANTVTTLTSAVDKIRITQNISYKTNTRTVVTRNNSTYYIYNANATDVSQLTRCYDIPSGYSYSARSMSQRLTENNTAYDFQVYQFNETVMTVTYKAEGGAYSFYALNVPAILYNSNLDSASGGTTQMPQPIEGSIITSTSASGSNISFVVGSALYGSIRQRTIGSSTVGFTYKYYQGQPLPSVRAGTTTVYMGTDAVSTLLYERGISPYSFGTYQNVTYGQNDQSSTQTVTTWNGVPNIMLDDGYFYMFADIELQGDWSNSTNIWPYNSQKMAFKGALSSYNNQTGAPTVTPVSGTMLGLSGSYCLRGISYVVDQNFIGITAKACSTKSASPATLLNGKENGASSFIEAFYSNAISAIRYLPGTARKSDWSYYSYILTGNPAVVGPSEDLLTFTPGGFRVAIPDTNFNMLYNTYTSNYSYMQGISYSNNVSEMGTLLTPWQSINNHYYVSKSSNGVVYRNKDNVWIELYIEEGSELFTVLEDRLVVVNTTSYINCFDSKAKKFMHYATDYNGRVMHGSNTPRSFQGTIATGTSEYSAYPYIRYTADAINPLYAVMPRDVVSSMLLPITARYRCYAGEEQAFGSSIPETDLGIDMFWSDFTSTNCIYRRTYLGNSIETKHELQGLAYPGSINTTASLSPNLFTKFINGAGNNDIVIEDYDAYTLTYYDNNPHLLYSAATQVSNLYNDGNVFFVLQGQFYGVIGDKLYSLAYSNGAIAGMDAIIDTGDLQFIGNNPMISFWYDPATRVIRSFTGDANLEFLYSATKIKKYYQSWYDETTQSIFAATDAGLLVFGSRNTYLLEDYKNVSNVQFSNDGVTHITNNGMTDNIVYYKEEGYEPVPLDFETSFYGLGATESTTIDRWNITLYDLEGDHPESYITVGVRSLTDITVKSEEKTFKITPDMYDKWSNSVLIAYSPKLIKGQGIRLYVKTPLTVQSVVPHIMDNKTGTTTRREL